MIYVVSYYFATGLPAFSRGVVVVVVVVVWPRWANKNLLFTFTSGNGVASAFHVGEG